MLRRLFAPLTLLAALGAQAIGATIGDPDDWRAVRCHLPWGYAASVPVFLAPGEADAIAESLSMDEGERLAFRALLEGARAEHRARWLGAFEGMYDESFAKAAAGERHDNRNATAIAVLELEDARRDAIDGVLRDLELLLDDERRAALPAAMRDHRRRVWLRRQASLPGEGADLAALVSDLVPEPDDELLALVELYHDTLDRPFATRDRAARRIEAIVARALAKGDNPLRRLTRDEDVEREVRDEAIAMVRASDEIVAVQRRFAGRLASAVPEGARDAFEAEAALRLAEHAAKSERSELERALDAMARGEVRADGAAAWSAATDHRGVFAPPSTPALRPAQREAVDRILRSYRSEQAVLRREFERDRGDSASETWVWLTTGTIGVALEMEDGAQGAKRNEKRDEREQEAWGEYRRRVAALEVETMKSVRDVLDLEQRIALLTQLDWK